MPTGPELQQRWLGWVCALPLLLLLQGLGILSKAGERSAFSFAGHAAQGTLSADFLELIFHSDKMRPKLHSKCIWHARDPARMPELHLWHSHLSAGLFQEDHVLLLLTAAISMVELALYKCSLGPSAYQRDLILISTMSTAVVLPWRWIYWSWGARGRICKDVNKNQFHLTCRFLLSPLTISSINSFKILSLGSQQKPGRRFLTNHHYAVGSHMHIRSHTPLPIYSLP